MRYITDDDKKFDSFEEADKHEKELIEIKKKNEKKEEERKELGKKIEKAYEDYCTLLKEYVSKYGKYSYTKKYNDDILLNDFPEFFSKWF